jgi:hypothetical protein
MTGGFFFSLTNFVKIYICVTVQQFSLTAHKVINTFSMTAIHDIVFQDRYVEKINY